MNFYPIINLIFLKKDLKKYWKYWIRNHIERKYWKYGIIFRIICLKIQNSTFND